MGPEEKPPSREDLIQEALLEFHKAWYAGKHVDIDAFLEEHGECGPGLRIEIEDFLFMSTGLNDVNLGLEAEPGAPGTAGAGPETKTIHDFRILREIGRGGMGVVYEAEQLSLRRRVALKVLPAHLSFSTDSIMKFRREAEAGARQSHPCIVSVFAVGEKEGTNYIAQELVEGGFTLDDRLEEQKGKGDLPQGYFRDTARIFSLLADAFHHAHASGVIHRDIKPSNILLTRNMEPKITDFGLAKVQDALALSRSGDFAGTPYYMAPEQAKGKASSIDPRTDIFSLGVTLYEALTLVRPFTGDTSMEVIKKVLLDEPVNPRKLNSRLPRDLSVIAMKAMEKNPADRYQTMAELAADLNRFLSGEVILAQPAGPIRRGGKWVKRHRGVAAALIGLLLVAVILAAVSIIQQARESTEFNSLLAQAEKAATAEQWDEAIGHLFKAISLRPDDPVAKERQSVYLGAKELSAVRKERDEKERALLEKEKAFKRSEGLQLAAQSSILLDKNPGLALLLAIESAKRQPGLLANNAMLAALDRCREERTLIYRRYPFTPELQRYGYGFYLEAAFSPDGEKVVTSARDNTPRIWDAASGVLLVTLGDGSEFFSQAVFSPDGQSVAAISLRKYIKIFDAEEGDELAVLKGHENLITTFLFSPGGDRLVTASMDNTARVWDAGRRKQLCVLEGHGDMIKDATFSPDGRLVVTASVDRTARIWDGETGQVQKVLRGHKDRLWAVAFHPDGRRLVTASAHTARIWNIDSGEEEIIIPGEKNFFFSPHIAAFSPDGRYVYVDWGNPEVRIFNASDGELAALLEGHTANVRSIRFSPDGKRIVTGSFDHTARVWDAGTGRELITLKGHEDLVLNARFSPDAEKVVTIAEDGTARIWDVSDRERLVAEGAIRRPERILFEDEDYGIADGRRLVTYDDEDSAGIMEPSGRVSTILKGHEKDVIGGRFDPGGKRVVTGSVDGTARIWNADTGVSKLILKMTGGKVVGARFTTDGERLWTVSEEGPVRIWDANSGELLVTYSGHNRWVISICSSSDHERMITASFDRTARIWDRTSGRELGVLKGHEAAVVSAAFSPDGRYVVTGSDDRTARIWDAERCEELATIRNIDMEGVRTLGFSPGDNEVVAVLKTGLSRVWPVDILEAALEKKPRELSVQERKKYGLFSETEDEAYQLVQGLYDEWLTKEKVVVRIEEDETLTAEVREAALRFAGMQEDNPYLLNLIREKIQARVMGEKGG